MNKTQFEKQSEQPRETENFWEEANNNLPETLGETNFRIPYEPISVKQLITRAEFAKEVSPETSPHSFIGKKINRKYFRHPLTQREYITIKSNRGNSPQILFSYVENQNDEQPNLDLGVMPEPENIISSQKSKYGELMDDQRIVRASRVINGTNLKGSEDQSFYYIENATDQAGVEYVSHEKAWKDKPDLLDYMTRGYLARQEGESSRLVLFCKTQSKNLNNDTLFFAVEYSDGKPTNVLTKTVPLSELPIFEEILHESPNSLFNALDSSKTIPGFSGDLTIGGVTMNFPKSINFNSAVDSFKSKNPISFAGAELSEDSLTSENVEDGLDINVDPEVNLDLGNALKSLKKRFGPGLLEVYFYGSIPRGYKRLESDIDIIAVIADSQPLTSQLSGFKNESQLLHDELGTYTAPFAQYSYRNIEVHTIRQSKFKKPNSLRLGEFLRNILDGSIKVYQKGNRS